MSPRMNPKDNFRDIKEVEIKPGKPMFISIYLYLYIYPCDL